MVAEQQLVRHGPSLLHAHARDAGVRRGAVGVQREVHEQVAHDANGVEVRLVNQLAVDEHHLGRADGLDDVGHDLARVEEQLGHAERVVDEREHDALGLALVVALGLRSVHGRRPVRREQEPVDDVKVHRDAAHAPRGMQRGQEGRPGLLVRCKHVPLAGLVRRARLAREADADALERAVAGQVRHKVDKVPVAEHLRVCDEHVELAEREARRAVLDERKVARVERLLVHERVQALDLAELREKLRRVEQRLEVHRERLELRKHGHGHPHLGPVERRVEHRERVQVGEQVQLARGEAGVANLQRRDVVAARQAAHVAAAACAEHLGVALLEPRCDDRVHHGVAVALAVAPLVEPQRVREHRVDGQAPHETGEAEDLRRTELAEARTGGGETEQVRVVWPGAVGRKRERERRVRRREVGHDG